MSRESSKRSLEAKKEVLNKYLQYWGQELMLVGSSHILLVISNGPLDQEESDDIDDDYKENLEDTVVTALERALLGQKKYDRTIELTLDSDEHPALATMDMDVAQYRKYKLTVYPALMAYEGKDFDIMAESCIIHELLHVTLRPLTHYLSALEGKSK